MSDPKPILYYGELSSFDRQNIAAAKNRVYDGLAKLVPATPENSRDKVVLVIGEVVTPWPGTYFVAVDAAYSQGLDKAVARCLNGMEDEWLALELAVEFIGGK